MARTAEFGFRIIGTVLGAWIPLSICTGVCDIRLPLNVLWICCVIATAMQLIGRPLKRFVALKRFVVCAVVFGVSLVFFENTKGGCIHCINRGISVITRYYDVDLVARRGGSSGELGITLFLVLVATILMFLASYAADGQCVLPWFLVSLSAPFFAIAVDVFPGTTGLCAYVGLLMYYVVTRGSYDFRASRSVFHRFTTAVLVIAMLLIANRIMEPHNHSKYVLNSDKRYRFADTLSQAFPTLFGQNGTGEFGEGGAGISRGKLPLEGRVEHYNLTDLVVTMPEGIRELYLRASAYSDYSGYAWSHDYYTTSYWEITPTENGDIYWCTMAARLGREYMWNGIGEAHKDTVLDIGADDRAVWTPRFAVERAQITVETLRGDKTLGYAPYDSLYGANIENMSQVRHMMDVDPEGCLKPNTVTSKQMYDFVYAPSGLPVYLAYSLDPDKALDMTAFFDQFTAMRLSEYDSYAYDVCLRIPSSCRCVFDIVDSWEKPASLYDAVSMVQNYLDTHCTYTLNAGQVPGGYDFIEYFLMENRKGFCMHFASAGVMLFRALGIPARFAEGYVVSSSAISEGESEGTTDVMVVDAYGSHTESRKMVSVDVLDSSAHAWVEIYVENFGWIPIEVTSGYETYNSRIREALSTPIVSVITPTPTPTPIGATPTPTPAGNKPTGKPGENVTPTPAVTGAPKNTTPTPKPTSAVTKSGDDSGKGGKGFTLRIKLPKWLRHTLIGILVLLIPFDIFGVRSVLLAWRRKKNQTRRPNRAITAVCRDVGTLLRARGLEPIAGESEHDWVERAVERFGREKELRYLYQIGNLVTFSGISLTREESKKAIRIYRRLRKDALAERKLPGRVALWLKYGI
ncbi:MAG: transglutaminase domain-containing protein [Lachnospiraceae bacterium]|nr:transglutaminase domain-containing protein [Lachnospiraceae bacterium]